MNEKKVLTDEERKRLLNSPELKRRERDLADRQAISKAMSLPAIRELNRRDDDLEAKEADLKDKLKRVRGLKMTTTLRRSSPERSLHVSCVSWLEAMERMGKVRNCVWFHVPNGERRDARTGAKLKKMGAKAGIADLILARPGVTGLYAVEFKSEKGRANPAQRAFFKTWEGIGGQWAEVRKLDEFIAKMQEWGISR